MDAVERCEELASVLEALQRNDTTAPEADASAIRQILAERTALIAAFPCYERDGGGWCVPLNGGTYHTREEAVLAAAGIEREGA
jgi:hypothetical protein